MDIQKLKVGDEVEVDISVWHGSSDQTDRHEGVIMRIGPSTFGDVCLELEMSIVELGKLGAHQTAKATVTFISRRVRLTPRPKRRSKQKKGAS